MIIKTKFKILLYIINLEWGPITSYNKPKYKLGTLVVVIIYSS